jgi:hypothetical protein
MTIVFGFTLFFNVQSRRPKFRDKVNLCLDFRQAEAEGTRLGFDVKSDIGHLQYK